jgi:4-hydroxythreonine-4-phosphate dehydrogenase
MSLPKIAISIGDINGIGPEVILKTFSELPILSLCTPIIYASNKSLSWWRKKLKMDHFNFTEIASADKALAKHVNLINVWDEELQIEPGKELPVTGKYAVKSFIAAAADVKKGLADILVTAPISKKNTKSTEFNFNGHTDYLAKQFGNGDSLMLMVSDNLRIALATVHVPIHEVSKNLNTDKLIKIIDQFSLSLYQDFGINSPKIALLGLNPHAGEQGNIGQEEQTIIIPAIQKLSDKKQMIFGPYAADGFFGSGQYQKFDGILAMYHDQGLIPFKTIAFGSGTNFTAGLSIVRTSPDHGTGFDIAGNGIANEDSFRSAIFAGIDIFRNKQSHAIFTADPLKKSVLKGEGSVA